MEEVEKEKECLVKKGLKRRWLEFKHGLIRLKIVITPEAKKDGIPEGNTVKETTT